jgi:xanthine dehydrogenase YagS FAD-binding subunit
VRPFAYERASDPARAVAAVAGRPGARFLAGGTNLVDLMKLGVEAPDLLVDVSHLALDGIDVLDDGTLRVGAVVRNSELAADPEVRRRYPVLAEALLDGASGQLRNLATVGGNLLQRTRCPYFQDVTRACNRRTPGSGCGAIDGEHGNHAVLGTSDRCVATHPSDMAVALAALDAEVAVRDADADGERRIPVTELHRLPGDEPWLETVLPQGALITAVLVPPLPDGMATSYRKVRDRASFAFAVVSVAAGIVVKEGIVVEARLAFGGVAARPWRARAAEKALRGAPADEASFGAAADAELAAARPLPGNAYKVPLLRNVAVRSLAELAARARP